MRKRGAALPCAGLLWASLLWVAPLTAFSQYAATDATAPVDDTITLDTIRVTAPRGETVDLYRSKPPLRTPATVFDRAWREPVDLQQIGDEGGVVPILVRYAARKVAETARKIPGWKGPDQPAVARPPPLNELQLRRALQLQERRAAQE